MNDPEFVKVLNELAGLTSENYEAGRIYQYKVNNSGYDFFDIDGKAGEPWIDWKAVPGTNIGGFIHTHYDGLLPIFSPEDLLIPGYWDSLGGLADLERFSLGVVTPFGTYFLQITDIKQYKEFYSEYGSESGKEALEEAYNFFMHFLTPDFDYERAFAHFLNSSKTGLTLMKKANNQFNKVFFDDWKGDVIEKPC